MRCGVVGANGHALKVAGRRVCLEHIHVGAAIPNRLGDDRSVEFYPLVRTAQRMQQAAIVNFPVAELKIEIMLPVTLVRRRDFCGWLLSAGPCQHTRLWERCRRSENKHGRAQQITADSCVSSHERSPTTR